MSTFTDDQARAFGEIVIDNFGANIQTGFWRSYSVGDIVSERSDLEGEPYIATQMGPNLPVVFHIVKDDGEIISFR